RRPVDPPPVIDLHVFRGDQDVLTGRTIQCQNMFILQATLHAATGKGTGYRDYSSPPQTSNLIGSTVASVNFMKHPPPGRAYFLFQDLSIRQEGHYRLIFTLFEICSNEGVAVCRAQVSSDAMTVYSPKKFPGLDISSALMREIASQGGKVRIRREAR
ncbi:velvet factor, partial [Dipodascopsis tothii]|uniref:velvet factor n=1 Tax=Dipodascopsis tothii TaxID=44089 RepID=UPI0034CF31B1